jgi:hypothetical protein
MNIRNFLPKMTAGIVRKAMIGREFVPSFTLEAANLFGRINGSTDDSTSIANIANNEFLVNQYRH